MTRRIGTRRSHPIGAFVGRAVFAVTILLLVIASIGLVVISPFALRGLDNDSQIDWNRLSVIGQTYGAVSAVIATVALSGVVVSLFIQGREIKEARKNARRAHHVELMRMAMDDPRYMECWGPYLTETFATERQYTYVNLIVAHWFSEYEVGELSDNLLRATAKSVFRSAPGRHYWADTGTFWRDNYSGRRARRFYRVLEQTYQEVRDEPQADAPPVIDTTGSSEQPKTPPRSPSRRWRAVVAAVAGAAAAAMFVARALGRSRRRH